MKKTNTVQILGNNIFREQKLTIGLDLGDCCSFYCVLDEAGKIILERRVATRVKNSPQKGDAKGRRT